MALTRIECSKNSSGKNFDAAGAHRDTYRTYVVKKTSGMFFTIHVLVNGPTGYMKKFSRNFFHDIPPGKYMVVFYKNSSGKNFDAAGAHRDTYRTYVVNPSLTFD